MAHQTSQTSIRFGGVNDLLDGCVHHAAVEHGGIVASSAPLRRPRAHDVLHVLDALAVPLVIERGEVVRGAAPLFVDIFVTTLARL